MVLETSFLPGSAATLQIENNISLGHDLKTGTQNILCGIPQGSMLGSLLFLLYVNDLPNSSILEPIMFADDANLFFEHRDFRILFSVVNDEWKKFMNGLIQINFH